jgi:hypothetical protein
MNRTKWLLDPPWHQQWQYSTWNTSNTGINTDISKPAHWYRYVDDTFTAWPHRKETLKEFLKYLNGIHQNIRFTMEIENKALPLLHILVTTRLDSTLTHTV